MNTYTKHTCDGVECTKKLRTQSAIAEVLEISRQAVSLLIKNKERTKIPMQNDKFGDYAVCSEVIGWYLHDFDPGRGPNRGIRATTVVEQPETAFSASNSTSTVE